MQYTTIQKNITMSPRKVRLVADMVRSMDPYRALDVLQFTNKAAALPLSKAIKTVLANAGRTENLSFLTIEVNEGLKIKRYKVGTAGRGRGRPFRRRLSHIKIVLTDDVEKMSKNVKSGVKNMVAAAAKEEVKVVEEPRKENEVIEAEIVETKKGATKS
jgi:large subunit ribosomal protein L22